MSDLISRQDAIKRFGEDGTWLERQGVTTLTMVEAKQRAVDILESLPSADEVELVRCKDCLMTKERDEYTGKVWCCRHREYMNYMYYCADGLRREDGEA